MADQLREAGVLVAHLNRGLQGGLMDLKTVPITLKRVIREEMWRVRVDPSSGRRFEFETFAAFVHASPPGGLAADEPTLRHVCHDDAEARDMLTTALQREAGRPGSETVDNVHDKRPTGNAEATALRRLHKDRPDLHKRVLAGSLSANRAMIEAGFRRPMASVPVDSPEAAVRALLRRFTIEELRTALDAFIES